jgi:RIO-like serine/threonine protein kinase
MHLKSDLFGSITRIQGRDGGGAPRLLVQRDTRGARWWLRWFAIHLAGREERALRRLAGMPGVPALIERREGVLLRSWIEGAPMQLAQPRDPRYYREALHLLRRLHRAGVVHNDLAKEPNWLVSAEGHPAVVDFQLSAVSARRSRLFRMRARDDLRHLLKHKRTYCPQRLTPRQHHILATPSVLARAWMGSGKKVYHFITRRVLHWADREGAGDRRWNS